MKKIYFKKQKYTNDSTIRYFYFNKKSDSSDELQFLKNKIKSLLNSKITSDSVKKQLKKLNAIDFNKFNSFYIYSNSLKYAIDDEFVLIFDKNFYSLFDKKISDEKIKFMQIKLNSSNSNDSIDDDDLPSSDNDDSNDDE